MADGKHLFGPVPSRRLGLSLGVDIVPLKVCTQNCIYCQLGVDGQTTVDRREYVDIDVVLAELKAKIDAGLVADYITLSGSGEPTLNSGIGRLIDGIKAMTDIRLAVITNGTLLGDASVRGDIAKADVVLPSLDAGDAETFGRMNCPNGAIDFDGFVEGLVEFCRGFSGEVWLEVFFSQGVNTSEGQVDKMRGIIERIAPGKVQLNTAVRPTAHAEVVCVAKDDLERIAERIGMGAEVIADYSKAPRSEQVDASLADVLETLRRRPCTLEGLCAAMGIGRNEAVKYLTELEGAGKVVVEVRGQERFYKVL